MTLSRSLDVAIVGAGPAGIGTAVAFERLDIEYVVLERDRIGSSFRQWPDEMRLLTPSFPANAFGVRDLNAITLDTSPVLALDREHPTGDQYADYLEAVAEFHDLPIESGVDVEDVVPDDGSADERSGDEHDGTTGSNRDGFTLVLEHPFVDRIATKLDLERGYRGVPILDDETLAWRHASGDRAPLFVTGALAAGTVGPLAGNIAGARRAADRITRALEERRHPVPA